ncbi:MAG: cyclase family protein [Deltaproteobacteria bacterium]|nr:cyclase family protein [Deltaproteobacteria bacterium]
MKVIDLSHAIHPEIPVYPGTAPPVITRANTIEADGFAELRLELFTHTGTHLDAPCHVLEGAPSLDQLPAGNFLGPGVILDLGGCSTPELDLALLEPHAERLEGAAFALLHTGWSRHWGSERYFEAFPHLTPRAAGWLARRGLKGVGIDTLSVDPLASEDLPAHRHLLGQGMVIIENLTRLAEVPAGAFTFSCLPLPIRGGDGSPVRAVAIVD